MLKQSWKVDKLHPTLEKIVRLVSRRDGVGISMNIVAKYIGVSQTAITYYLRTGITPSQKVIDQYEEGLSRLAYEIINTVNGVNNGTEEKITQSQ